MLFLDYFAWKGLHKQRLSLRLQHLRVHKILGLVHINQIQPLIIHGKPCLYLFIGDQTPSFSLLMPREHIRLSSIEFSSLAYLWERSFFRLFCYRSSEVCLWFYVWSPDFAFEKSLIWKYGGGYLLLQKCREDPRFLVALVTQHLTQHQHSFHCAAV